MRTEGGDIRTLMVHVVDALFDILYAEKCVNNMHHQGSDITPLSSQTLILVFFTKNTKIQVLLPCSPENSEKATFSCFGGNHKKINVV